MKKSVTVAGLCLFSALQLAWSGCTQAPHPRQKAAPRAIPVQQAPPTPVETKRLELGGPEWNPGWDTLIEQALPSAMLSSLVPRDVRRFCPAFFQMSVTGKRGYWAYFFQALAAAESGLNAKTNVLHSDMGHAIDRVTGRDVRSEGLLQLTYEDQKRYGCNFNWRADRRLPPKDRRRTILQPKNDLMCGIKILDDQIITRHKPLFTRSSYWSTLRPGTESYRVFAKQMINPPAACELQEKIAHARARHGKRGRRRPRQTVAER